MSGHINNKYFLNNYLEENSKKLKSKIESVEVTESTNQVQLLNKLLDEFSLSPLEIGEPKPSEPTEEKIQKKSIFNETYYQTIYKIKVTIPYEGTKDLFFCKPSTCTVVYFSNDFQIYTSSVIFEILLEKLDLEIYELEVNNFINGLTANIGRINSEVTLYNSQLEQRISSLLSSRLQTLSQKFDFMEKIGLRVNPKSEDYMVPSPIAKKKIPVPISEIDNTLNKKIIPILQDTVYKDIREVLYNVGKAVERKPSLYIGKHEEDLRDIFLLFLETRYDSTTGVGEAFNKVGKTDILLKFSKDGSNLFVAECKFWKGQKKLHEAIDQLLGYLTHRDSKTALMMFVDQKDFTSVIETTKTEIIKHPNFYKYLRDSYSSSISYQFSLPSDDKSKIQIEVMFFHFPPIT